MSLSVQTDDYVITSYDVIPYDIQSSAIDFAESVLYNTPWDYVYTMTYDSVHDTYTYKLFYGSGLRSLSNGFAQCNTCTVVYDVDKTTLTRSGNYSGSESGTVTGIENGGIYHGSESGSLSVPASLFTVSQAVTYGEIIDGVTFNDTSGFIYSSIENYPHLKRGVNYAELGQALVVPLLLGAVAVGLFIQIFRRFG